MFVGFQREPGPAMEFIRRKFQSTQQTQKKNKVMIYTHETCATGDNDDYDYGPSAYDLTLQFDETAFLTRDMLTDQ